MRVLLVEDDPMIGNAVHGALNDASWAADWVKDGNSALTALRTQHYDLVLLDLGLPGRDGLEVLRSIRSQPTTLPVLIVTARDALDDRIAGLDAGADDYILKPFEISELLARMRAVLRRQGGQAERAGAHAQIQHPHPAVEAGGGQAGVVDGAGQHGGQVQGEDLVGPRQGRLVGLGELGHRRAGRRGAVVPLDGVQFDDADAALGRERGGQEGRGVGDDGEGHGRSVAPCGRWSAPAQRPTSGIGLGVGRGLSRTQSTASSQIRSAAE